MSDYLTVPASQEAMHARLTNWARWCHGSGGRACLSIWRGYRPDGGYIETTAPSAVDTKDAAEVQKLMPQIPERHRLAVGYWYVFPGRSVHKIQRQLGCTKDGLAALVADARIMLRNLA